MEIIFEMIGSFFVEIVLGGICVILIWIGAFVFSLLSFFKKSPDYFYTDDPDRKFGLGLTGVVVVGLLYMLFFNG